MKIAADMDLDRLASQMGTLVTSDEAQRMRQILVDVNHNNPDIEDTWDVGEFDWAALCKLAVKDSQ